MNDTKKNVCIVHLIYFLKIIISICHFNILINLTFEESNSLSL